jgi:hypothetical protein
MKMNFITNERTTKEWRLEVWLALNLTGLGGI